MGCGPIRVVLGTGGDDVWDTCKACQPKAAVVLRLLAVRRVVAQSTAVQEQYQNEEGEEEQRRRATKEDTDKRPRTIYDNSSSNSNSNLKQTTRTVARTALCSLSRRNPQKIFANPFFGVKPTVSAYQRRLILSVCPSLLVSLRDSGDDCSHERGSPHDAYASRNGRTQRSIIR